MNESKETGRYQSPEEAQAAAQFNAEQQKPEPTIVKGGKNTGSTVEQAEQAEQPKTPIESHRNWRKGWFGKKFEAVKDKILPAGATTSVVIMGSGLMWRLNELSGSFPQNDEVSTMAVSAGVLTAVGTLLAAGGAKLYEKLRDIKETRKQLQSDPKYRQGLERDILNYQRKIQEINEDIIKNRNAGAHDYADKEGPKFRRFWERELSNSQRKLELLGGNNAI